MHQTSKFDNGLEDDFEGAEQTMQFDTERLRIFPEEYEMLRNMEDDENRILAKQWVFFQYEKELKKHFKQEKERRLQDRKQQRLLQ